VAPPPDATSAKSVLIVEDNDDLRDLYAYWLEREGFAIFLAADGAGALQIIEGCTPDVLVLDLHLRTLDGLSVLQEIAEDARTCHIPVIVVAASHAEAIPHSAARVLCKPVSEGQLVGAVRMAVE
jgi:CheY-like chemotaxis protein